MPTPRFLVPIKDALKRDKGDCGHQVDKSSGNLVVKDYAAIPTPSESGSDISILSTDAKHDVPQSKVVTKPEDYPLTEQGVPISSDNVNPLDVKSEQVTQEINQKTETDDEDEENALSETQLRRLYDDEEIERFLSIFATHVNEITLAPSVADNKPRRARVLRTVLENGDPGDIRIVPIDDGDQDSDAETDTDEPWTYMNPDAHPNIHDTGATLGPGQEMNVTIDPNPPARYLSSRVATWVIAKLPPAPVAPPTRFRLGVARLAGQRVYLSTYPYYAPFFTDLIKLAAWSDWYHSARVCAAWWLLWYFNLLLPALLGKITFALMRHGVMRNPTLSELRKRRKVSEEADTLSEAMEGHGAAAGFLGTGPTPGIGSGGGDMGVADLWKLGKLVMKGKGKKAKAQAQEAANNVASQAGASIEIEHEEVDHEDKHNDWRQSAVKALEDVADFHERVRNLFLWRREQSSRIYALALAILTLFTALVPAQLLAKMTYATIGVLYWFITPVVLAMPADALKRLPPPLADVPSDSEYAMSLISARVAQGENIIPASHRGGRQGGRVRRFVAPMNPNINTDTVVENAAKDLPKESGNWGTDSGHKQDVESMKREANEKEAIAAEERAEARGVIKTVNSEEVAAQQDNQSRLGTLDRLKNQWEASKVDLLGGKDKSEESFQGIGAPETVPANYKAAPGSLTLSSESITFTPLMASTPRYAIGLEQIQGVKKTHHTNGLRIRYKDSEGVEQEIVFRFITSRDEIFGKLVGWGGKRWRKV